jgi:hypothetical protein
MDGVQDIGIKNGKIVSVGRNLKLRSLKEIDAHGEVVIPFFKKSDRFKSNQSSRSNSGAGSLPSLGSVHSSNSAGTQITQSTNPLAAPVGGNAQHLKSKEYGDMLAKLVQLLQRKSTLRGQTSGYIAHFFNETLDKAATAGTFFGLVKSLGVQTAKWRVEAFFEVVFGRRRYVPTEELVWFFDSLQKIQSKKKIWRCPEHHTATVRSFADPNMEATCMKKRRPSAIDGTSMNILGARRIGSAMELAATREEFSMRKREKALQSLQGSIMRKLGGKDIEKVFHIIDSDNNGTLSPFEVKMAYRKLGVFHLMSPQLCNAMFKEMDLNGDGEIDLEEWKKFMDLGTRREIVKKDNKLKYLAQDHLYNRRTFT